MKTILVLTDSSEQARHIAKTGVLLGEKLKEDVLLYNAYLHLPIIPYYEGRVLKETDDSSSKKESEEGLQKLSMYLHTVIDHIGPNDYRPVIHMRSGIGALGEVTNEIIAKRDIAFILMGAPADSRMDHILFGSDTTSVIDAVTRPVIILPSKANLNKFKKVIFATDFEDADRKAIDYLVKLGRATNFELDIVHVDVIGKLENVKSEAEIDFEIYVAGLNYPKVTYHKIKGKNIIHRLNNLCGEMGADLLAMVQDQHSVLMRILKEGNVKTALSIQNFPVMIFPAKMYS